MRGWSPLFLWVLIVGWSATAPAIQGRLGMSISFLYQGQRMEATFLSNIHGYNTLATESALFLRLTQFLDQLRLQNYSRDQSEEERKILRDGFFSHERLARHDELLVLHRGIDWDHPQDPTGLGPEILGMVAIDRLGHPKPEYHSTYHPGDYEKLLVERRLSSLEITVPRPQPHLWTGSGLPPGVHPHWDSFIGMAFFQPGRIYVGDVIQANGFFATEGLAPLLYTLANRYGLFSTGRIVYPAREKIIEGVTIHGPAVLVPTLVVWETFNKLVEGKRKEGSRTRYYRRAGARPLTIGGVEEWVDPLLGANVLVQILSQAGDDFRNWQNTFFSERDQTGLESLRVDRTRFERMEYGVGGGWLPPGHQSLAHHPTRFLECAPRLTQVR